MWPSAQSKMERLSAARAPASCGFFLTSVPSSLARAPPSVAQRCATVLPSARSYRRQMALESPPRGLAPRSSSLSATSVLLRMTAYSSGVTDGSPHQRMLTGTCSSPTRTSTTSSWLSRTARKSERPVGQPMSCSRRTTLAWPIVAASSIGIDWSVGLSALMLAPEKKSWLSSGRYAPPKAAHRCAIVLPPPGEALSGRPCATIFAISLAVACSSSPRSVDGTCIGRRSASMTAGHIRFISAESSPMASLIGDFFHSGSFLALCSSDHVGGRLASRPQLEPSDPTIIGARCMKMSAMYWSGLGGKACIRHGLRMPL